MADESHCIRCLRPNPDSAEGSLPLDWEVLEDDRGEVAGVVCEGCVTGAEQQAMDEDVMETMDEIARNQEWEL